MNDARICQAHPGKIDNPDWHENFNTDTLVREISLDHRSKPNISTVDDENVNGY